MRRSNHFRFIFLVSICAVALVAFIFFFPKQQAPFDVRYSVSVGSGCPYRFLSWNIANFGKSKTQEQVTIIARVISSADIIAIQEVTAGKEFGARAVASLVEELKRQGHEYDYIVSDPTQPKSPSVERYAFIVKKGISFSRRDARLLKEVENEIEREPYLLEVTLPSGSKVALFNFHAVPTEKNPLVEVGHLHGVLSDGGYERAIFAGDFNLPARLTDRSFNKFDYQGHIREKTSLKQRLTSQNTYLLHQYDNVYTKGVSVCSAGVVDFVEKYFSPVSRESLEEARKVSDHLPVFIAFK